MTAVWKVFAIEGGSALVVGSLLAAWARRRFTPRAALAQTEK
ncbi:MAG TPA: hypothetical protein VHX38_40985 [Pseudonocardiaceae bacterium]|nr:hypothetical protein [Pseudonocardiaceae bacterium]